MATTYTRTRARPANLNIYIHKMHSGMVAPPPRQCRGQCGLRTLPSRGWSQPELSGEPGVGTSPFAAAARRRLTPDRRRWVTSHTASPSPPVRHARLAPAPRSLHTPRARALSPANCTSPPAPVSTPPLAPPITPLQRPFSGLPAPALAQLVSLRRPAPISAPPSGTPPHVLPRATLHQLGRRPPDLPAASGWWRPLAGPCGGAAPLSSAAASLMSAW